VGSSIQLPSQRQVVNDSPKQQVSPFPLTCHNVRLVSETRPRLPLLHEPRQAIPLQLSYKLFNNLHLAVPQRTTPRTKLASRFKFGTLPRSSPASILSVRPKPRTMTGNKTLSYSALSVFFSIRLTLSSYDVTSAPPSPPLRRLGHARSAPFRRRPALSTSADTAANSARCASRAVTAAARNRKLPPDAPKCVKWRRTLPAGSGQLRQSLGCSHPPKLRERAPTIAQAARRTRQQLAPTARRLAQQFRENLGTSKIARFSNPATFRRDSASVAGSSSCFTPPTISRKFRSTIPTRFSSPTPCCSAPAVASRHCHSRITGSFRIIASARSQAPVSRSGSPPPASGGEPLW